MTVEYWIRSAYITLRSLVLLAIIPCVLGYGAWEMGYFPSGRVKLEPEVDNTDKVTIWWFAWKNGDLVASGCVRHIDLNIVDRVKEDLIVLGKKKIQMFKTIN